MNIEAEVANMLAMKVSELREKYREVFGDDTSSRNKRWLIKRIAWRIQANAMGGLSERAKRRAAELANDADVRVLPPRSQPTIKFAPRANVSAPTAGTEITRMYKGQLLVVKVTEDGFVFEGQKFKSLSAVAKHITGSHCSGQAFFKTKGPK